MEAPVQQGDPLVPCCRTPRPDWFGPALRRYDPRLRVRWSHERRQWAIEARAKSRLAMFRPVVRFKNEFGRIVEQPLPERSERMIHWHDITYPLLYARELDVRLFTRIVAMDAKRVTGNMIDKLDAAERLKWQKEREATEAHFRDKAADIYEHGNWLSGSKMFMRSGSQGPSRVLI